MTKPVIFRNKLNYISVLLAFLVLASIFQFAVPETYIVFYFSLVIYMSFYFEFVLKSRFAKLHSQKVFPKQETTVLFYNESKFDFFEEFIIIGDTGLYLCKAYMPIQKYIKKFLNQPYINLLYPREVIETIKVVDNHVICTLKSGNGPVRIPINVSNKNLLTERVNDKNYVTSL